MFQNAHIKTVTPPRPGKKLLVLDLDRTLADFHPNAPNREHKSRPYLLSFLTTLYTYYDIVIWSGTDSDLLLKKLRILGVWQNPHFSILACLDCTHMRARNISLGPVILTKPLQVLWDEYPQYDFTNTIILDDKVDNLYFNRRNGLLVTPYSFEDYASDNELYYLTTYLENIAQYCDDFSSLDHKQWPYYQPEIPE